ncbi:MAG: DUF370 domain-containing protein [Firmicutes bacterium]|nr:DUF370 domain-containing protein [Bacillota bacterium]
MINLFVHLGKNAVVRSNQIVAIIDWQTLQDSEVNQAYMERVNQGQKIKDVSGGRPNSMVITGDDIYLSTISSTTLKKRAENPQYLACD